MMSENQQQQRLMELVVKKISGTLSVSEEQELLDQMKADVGASNFVNKFSPEVIASDIAMKEEIDTAAAWEKVRVHAGFRRKSIRWNAGFTMAVAASLLLIITTGLYLFFNRNDQRNTIVQQGPMVKDIPRPEGKAILTLADGKTVELDRNNSSNEALKGQGILNLDDKELQYGKAASNSGISYNTVSTPRGISYKLTLPDGTGVWLNTSSSIRFPTAFAGNQREVSVTGETYFEVSANQEKPFIVRVNNVAVQVLGTHFNIEAWPEKAIVNTTLLQGSVSVENANRKVKLKPGQQAIVAKTVSVNNDTDLDQVMAWKQGKFVFRANTIQDIMENLARYYDFEVEYSGTITSSLFVGTFERSAPLSDILLFLEKTGGVHFRVKDRKVVVMP